MCSCLATQDSGVIQPAFWVLSPADAPQLPSPPGRGRLSPPPCGNGATRERWQDVVDRRRGFSIECVRRPFFFVFLCTRCLRGSSGRLPRTASRRRRRRKSGSRTCSALPWWRLLSSSPWCVAPPPPPPPPARTLFAGEGKYKQNLIASKRTPFAEAHYVQSSVSKGHASGRVRVSQVARAGGGWFCHRRSRCLLSSRSWANPSDFCLASFACAYTLSTKA